MRTATPFPATCCSNSEIISVFVSRFLNKNIVRLITVAISSVRCRSTFDRMLSQGRKFYPFVCFPSMISLNFYDSRLGHIHTILIFPGCMLLLYCMLHRLMTLRKRKHFLCILQGISRRTSFSKRQKEEAHKVLLHSIPEFFFLIFYLNGLNILLVAIRTFLKRCNLLLH